ncbi:hypothetical protein LQW54_004335 [Pestalotiopsis sp. IQ-011]
MDPLSALAIAAAVIQFVDYGSRLVKRTWDVYKTAAMNDLEGIPETENDQLEGISNELKQLAQSVRDSTGIHQEHRQPTKAETNLMWACEESEKVNAELQDLLAKIRRRPILKHQDDRNPRYAVAKIWEKDKIGQMEQRMENLRRQAMGAVLVCLW